jgi:[ribosomal protein S5]-alanine N-acetyltransferase
VIRTARLLLRRARMEDLDALHAVMSDRRAMRYWDRPPHGKIGATEAFLRWMVEAPRDWNEDFVVERDGAAIGKVGAWRLPEVGFILRPDQWGQGIGREAMTAAIGHILAQHPVPALTAEADPRNERSLRLLARLGFRETGRAERTIRVGEEWCDSVYLALAREDWPAAG